MDMVIWLMAVFSVGVVSIGVYWTFKAASKLSKYKWPVLVLVDKKTPAAKMAIKYVEKYIPTVESSIVIWKGKDGFDGGVLRSENMTDEEAAKLLLTALTEVGENIGIQAAIIRK